MRNLFLLFICTLFSLPTYAQWQRGLTRGITSGSTRTLATQRTINQALRKNILSTKTLLKSTLVLNPNDDSSSLYAWDNMKASAFVFEENYNGKTYLWGATAAHYFFQKPSLENSEFGIVPIEIIAQGHYDGNDIALFPIPDKVQKYVHPLKLAAHSAKKGETLVSAGYFDDGFQIEKDRVVTKVLPTRILTSLVVEDKLAREGACGGPVLNARREVVGMHVGSSDKRQEGFVVPVEHIYEILQAYHNNAEFFRPLYFNGKMLGQININEFVQYIETWKGDKLLERFDSHSKRALIDYNHLEKWVDVSQADKVVLIIERVPFSTVQQDQRTHEFELTYDLKTGQIKNEVNF